MTITKPDGTKDIKVLDSYFADSTAWFEYVADQVGTWKLKFEFPGGYFPPGNYTSPSSFTWNQTTSFTQSVYYKPSSTAELTLTVQEEQVLSWPPSPLPTDYWTRPISPENREWWPIAGGYPGTGVVGGGTNWPADTNTYMSNYGFTPYVQAPNTAHVVWKLQGAIGGLIGGVWGQQSWSAGGGTPSIVYAGRCYQTVTKEKPTWVNGTIRNLPKSVWQCYDLRTGQVYWELTDITAPSVISYKNNIEFGVAGLIGVPGSQAREPLRPAASLVSIGARLIKYDPWTGAVTLNVTGMSGTFYNDPYVLTVQTINATAGIYRLLNWTIGLSTTNFNERIANNISWPFSTLGTCDFEAGIAVTTYSIMHPATGVAIDMGIQAASLTTGQLLWNISAGVGYPLFSGSTAVADHGKFAVRFDDGY